MTEQINVKNRTGNSFDFQGIFRDVSKQWFSILLIGLSAALLTFVIVSILYKPNYTTKTALFVTGAGKSNVYNDVYNSSQVASKFTEIVNSNVLQNKVAKEIGQKGFIGTATAENIKETNIMEVRVTAPTAEISFQEMKSILENYGSVSDYVLSGAVLKILDPPRVPTNPDNPNNALKLAFLAFIGMMAAVAFGLGVLSYLRDTIRSEKDIENKLDTTLLASIPHENRAKTAKDKIRYENKNILITDPTTSFPYVESMDKLARRVKTKMDEMDARTLLVSSVMQNEGKSTVAANLALSMAKQGIRVILMDCDLRKPSQYKILGLEQEEFVSFGECLRDHKNPTGIIRTLKGTDLLAVLNKTILDNSTELITSDSFKELLNLLKEHVDYIIIDTSPTAMVADAEELAVLADAAIIVVKQNGVEAMNINDAIDSLNASGNKLLGCVFNDVHSETGTGVLSSLGYYGSYGSKAYGYGKYARGGRSDG